MDYSLGFWFFATLAAIAVGLGKGGLPVVAALAVPSLSLFMSPIAAAGLLLPVYIVSDAFALIAYRRAYNRQVLKIALIGMTLGVGIGSVTAHLIIEWLITVLIGLMGGLFALRMLTQRGDLPRNLSIQVTECSGQPSPASPASSATTAARLGKFLPSH